MHRFRPNYSVFLILAFALGILAEGRHQCVSDPALTSEAHARHGSGPASNPQDAGECECISHCCSLVTAAWTPQGPINAVVTAINVVPGITGSSQHSSSPQRFLLPPALAPPVAG